MRGEETNALLMFTAMLEIPPRARRRDECIVDVYSHAGNTSACAEKSRTCPARDLPSWKYLRVRGEEVYKHPGNGTYLEIPPRARRRDRRRVVARHPRRNTSACAEKRGFDTLRDSVTRKYLRVRGEEMSEASTVLVSMEIPPRARRRGTRENIRHAGRGNTSACAEKSRCRNLSLRRRRKYLRVRGEEARACTAEFSRVEIPPRARRRAFFGSVCSDMKGNTSACAEKSSVMPGRKVSNWKYLRVRGEEISIHAVLIATLEIPPRARRREPAGWCFDGGYGNTSACAEKSDSRSRQPLRPQKYLRVRGEEPGLAP